MDVQSGADNLCDALQQLRSIAEANPRKLLVQIEGQTAFLFFHTRSLVATRLRVEFRRDHTVMVIFPDDYPDSPPEIRITPPVVYHPNVPSDGRIEVSHWIPQFSIASMLKMLWRVLTFQELSADNIQNSEAQRWLAKKYLQLPLSSDALIVPVPRAVTQDQLEGQPGSLRVRQLRPALKQPGNRAAPAEASHPNAPSINSGVQEAVPLAADIHLMAQRLSDSAQPTRFRSKGIRKYQPPERLLPWAYLAPSEQSNADLDVFVVIHQSALDEVFRHGIADTRRERFGALLGGVYSDPVTGTDWVEVTGMIPAERVDAGISYVEVSGPEMARLDAHVDDLLTRSQGNIRKVGWYHTHPGHGIFMSSIDKANQARSYASKWHIALVFDPKNSLYGVFTGPDCEPVKRDHLRVIPDSVALAAASPVYTRKNISPLPEAGLPTAWYSDAAPESQPHTELFVRNDQEGLQHAAVGAESPAPVAPVASSRKSFSRQSAQWLSWTFRAASAVAVVALIAGSLYLFVRDYRHQAIRHSAQKSLLRIVADERSTRSSAAFTELLPVIVSLDPESVEGQEAAQMLDIRNISPVAQPTPIRTPYLRSRPTVAVTPTPVLTSTSAVTPTDMPSSPVVMTLTPKSRWTPPRQSPTRPTFLEYRIRTSDTLSNIGEWFDVSVKDILDLNPGIDPDFILEGTIIRIPAR